MMIAPYIWGSRSVLLTKLEKLKIPPKEKEEEKIYRKCLWIRLWRPSEIHRPILGDVPAEPLPTPGHPALIGHELVPSWLRKLTTSVSTIIYLCFTTLRVQLQQEVSCCAI